MAIKIMIDPGHFEGWNKVACGYAEGTQMWKLSQKLIPMLRAYGFTVGCTKSAINDYPKTSSGEDNITQRGRNAAGYDLMLSLHTNACGTESVNRPVIIYPISGKGKDLAGKLGAALQKCMGLQTYQIFQKYNSAGNADYYGVIRGAASVGVPCLIIEHTFHTNNTMAKWLLSDTNLTTVARCVADMVAAYYGYTTAGTTVTEDTTPSQATTTIYRIRKTWDDATSQVGAYANLDSAKKVCPDGYTVFNEKGKAVYQPTAATVADSSAGTSTSTWKNGSTSEPVYADTAKKTKVGSLNAYETCDCLGTVDGMYIVKYKVDGSTAHKVGVVEYAGGLG